MSYYERPKVEDSFPIRLVIRPRWKRVLYAPRLIRLYLRGGFGFWFSVRMVYQAIVFKGEWVI